MSPEVRAALENAGSVGIKTDGLPGPRRYRTPGAIRATVLAVVQELPSEMTLGELCDELNNASAQEAWED